jgi:Zn-dependent M16 (insulinase) family peptidase
MQTAEIADQLESLRRKITGSGLIVNVTGGALDSAGAEIMQRFSRFGPPVKRETVIRPQQQAVITEVFSSPSLQVGFAALSMHAAKFDTREQLAETVIAHQLSTGPLWENIRMKGGAYGAFSNSDSLEDCLSFATYRDPNPMRSLNAILEITKKKSYGKCTEDYLVKSIIGCYARETRPRTGAENGLVDFYRFLYGIEDSYRKRKIERLVSVYISDIASVYESLGARTATGRVVIAGEKTAEQAAKTLGTEVQYLKI